MNAGICSNCSATSGDLKRTWCRGCYLRWYKAGKPETGPPPLKNVTLAEWREIPDHQTEREPSDLEVGTAGEHLVCADLLLCGYTAFRTDQTCAYDVAVDLSGRLIRLQVKSTRLARVLPQRQSSVLAYRWHVRRRGRGGGRSYGQDDFDLLALVGLDVRQVAYLSQPGTLSIVDIRPPGFLGPGKQFTDYPFGRALNSIGVAA